VRVCAGGDDNQGMFDLLMGPRPMGIGWRNVSLMRDGNPPFRLDLGGYDSAVIRVPTDVIESAADLRSGCSTRYVETAASPRHPSRC